MPFTADKHVVTRVRESANTTYKYVDFNDNGSGGLDADRPTFTITINAEDEDKFTVDAYYDTDVINLYCVEEKDDPSDLSDEDTGEYETAP